MRNRRTTSGAAIVLGIVAALLAACSDPSPMPSSTTTFSAASPTPTLSLTPSPTPSVDPTIAAAEAAILAAYRGYWDAKVAVYADPSQTAAPDLERFAVDQAFADVGQTQLILRQNGIVFRGSPSIEPTVSSVVLGDGGTATITDCVDSTDWQPIYVATGKSAAAPGQAARLITESTAYFYNDHWTIRTSVVNRDKTC